MNTLKKLLTLSLTAMLLVIPGASQADPASDLAQFRAFFKEKFPAVAFDDYANGFYVLPGFEGYREQWKDLSDLPPWELGLGEGKRMWEAPFKNGKTFASCFINEGRKIAQGYPYWDEATKKVRTAEMDLLDCMKKNGEEEMVKRYSSLDKDLENRVALAKLTAYFYSLSHGERIKIDLSKPGAVRAYEAGKKFWWGKRGQLNFACADCHMRLAGANLGGNQPLSAALGHPVGWPAQRIEWQRIETIHFRYMTCNSQIRAKPLKHGSEAYNNLQFYETYLSNDLPLMAPAMRN